MSDFEGYIKLLTYDELIDMAIKTIRDVSQFNEELLLLGKEILKRHDSEHDS